MLVPHECNRSLNAILSMIIASYRRRESLDHLKPSSSFDEELNFHAALQKIPVRISNRAKMLIVSF